MKQTWKKITMGLAAACALAAATVHFAVGHAAEAQKEGVLVPILLYHSILKDPQRAGMHVLSPDTLEQDLRYLKDHGYTTVSIQQLIDAVYQDAPLPEKPVVLTFDDGYLNNLTYVLPLLEKYDMKATISIVGAYTEQAEREDDENPNYAYLKKQRIAEMAQSGRFEIGVHSYDMHGQQTRKGSAKNKGESTGQYQAVFRADTEQCVALLAECGVDANVYAYPYGAISAESEPVLKELGFCASLSCREKPNYITKDPDCLWQLGRYNRPSGVSTETFMQRALGEDTK